METIRLHIFGLAARVVSPYDPREDIKVHNIVSDESLDEVNKRCGLTDQFLGEDVLLIVAHFIRLQSCVVVHSSILKKLVSVKDVVIVSLPLSVELDAL